jgi:hypothetical protein
LFLIHGFIPEHAFNSKIKLGFVYQTLDPRRLGRIRDAVDGSETPAETLVEEVEEPERSGEKWRKWRSETAWSGRRLVLSTMCLLQNPPPASKSNCKIVLPPPPLLPLAKNDLEKNPLLLDSQKTT